MTTVQTHSVTLSTGRVVEFYDYDYTPAWAGDFTTPSEPAEIIIGEDASWSDTGITLTERELEDIVDGDPAIVAYIVALEAADGT